MIQPDKPAHGDDDDFDLELPGDDEDDEEGALREEESFLPDDDADLGLDVDEKVVGLDGDTGLDDAPESELEDDEEDDASWLGDDPFDPVLTGDDDEGDDEEEALGEDSEPAKDNADEWDDELLEEGNAPTADSGEEGFGEDAAANEIELEQLPPLDGIAADADEADDALSAELLDELPIAAGPDESTVEVAPGLRCTRLPAGQLVLETLARLDRPLADLVASGDAALAWDGALLVSSGVSSARPERRFGGVRPSALAALQTEAELLVALATPDGVLCSRDGGRTFARGGVPESGELGREWIANSIAWSASSAGPRLLAAAPAGGLWVSDDFGATWQPRPAVERVLALHAGGAAVVAVCRDVDGGARALRSRDGGDSFDAIVLPVREVERVQEVQALNGVLLCCRRAPSPQLVWRGQGDAWQELAAYASAPAALLDDDDQVSAYFFVQTKEHALLLRRVLDARGQASQPEIVCEFEHDAGTPLQLRAGHADGSPLLHIGTERGWYRVRIRPAGGSA